MPVIFPTELLNFAKGFVIPGEISGATDFNYNRIPKQEKEKQKDKLVMASADILAGYHKCDKRPG